MALLKCPDCGKMVSPRVENCPFCGCPSKFFAQEGENISENSKEEERIDKEKPEEVPEEEEEETVENIYFSLGK